MNIKKACKLLHVSRSGYYKYLHWTPPRRLIENEVYKDKIKAIFEANHGRYGTIRIQKSLEQEGIRVNRKRIGRLLHEMGLIAKGARYRYKHYNKKTDNNDIPNLLNQVFKSSSKNKIWVGDITYIPTQSKTLYLAVFIDIYSRKVVGWAMSTRMKSSLVVDAFLQGIGKEHPAEGLVVHTDHGSQFTSDLFTRVLKAHGAVHSESRKGNPYDNALMESFYRTIKRELIQDSVFQNPEQARSEIFKYIEIYYNIKRMHSALGYISPVQYEIKNS